MTREPRGRLDTVKRILRLWQHLEGRRWRPSLRDLALEFHVTARTVRRDLEVLEQLGLRVPPPMPPMYHGALGAEKRGASS